MNGSTESLCPICLEKISAHKYKKGADVFIEKNCPAHGKFTDKVAKDAKRFFDKTFSVEGKPFNPVCEYQNGCDTDCGWCDNHQQHICTGLIEITDNCNLSCPICYFGDKGSSHISIDEFKARLQTLIDVEKGHLDVLQISGGECLKHPEFCEILEEATKFDVGRIVVNTNGLELLSNDIVFNAIKKHLDKIDVYLQFDGFDDEVYQVLRGRPLLKEKLEILNKLNENEIKISLAVTVYQGNLKEIPAILKLSTEMKHIAGITFQRLTKVGSALQTEIPSVFQEDILLAIANSGLMEYKDMIPLPCSHENCTSLGFLFCSDGKIHSLGDYVDFTKCKGALSNRLAFDKTVLDYLNKNVCDCFVGKVLGNTSILGKLKDFTTGSARCYKDMKIVRILVKNFMDLDTFDFERARKCCTGISVGNGKVIPFCLRNALKGKRIW